MKKVIIGIGCVVSSFAFAASKDNITALDGVTLSLIEEQTLSIQNSASETVKIDIHGDEFSLMPASGLTLDCGGYSFFEIKIQGLDHDYFEVPCQSRVVFNETFNNQK